MHSDHRLHLDDAGGDLDEAQAQRIELGDAPHRARRARGGSRSSCRIPPPSAGLATHLTRRPRSRRRRRSWPNSRSVGFGAKILVESSGCIIINDLIYKRRRQRELATPFWLHLWLLHRCLHKFRRSLP